MSKTIAILTGGGDCPGLNAVIRGVVRAATLERGWRVIGIEDGFDGLVDGPRVRELDLAAVRGILPRGGTIIGTSNRGNPFQYPVMEAGETRLIDVSRRVLDNFRKLGAEALVAVGGDGTLKIADRLNELGLPVVGVPKTIDNDLRGTDVTFGYNTAVGIVTEALDRLHTTAESHQRVMVVEVMGRDAGWIALESGLAGSADVILIPEIPFQIDSVCQAIQRRRERGNKFSIVVVAEGAFPLGGDKVVQKSAVENAGIERLGGIGHFVAREIGRCLTMETRVVVLGHVQRGGSPSPFDRILGSRFGVKAVELIEERGFGKMVALRGRDVVSVAIRDAVGSLNLVDPKGDLIRTAEELGIMTGR
ncbi:ATP-dependent 6-phosphofructokinase [Desulfuromonas versatilis]|uniref:ATP-dependent 6-phosphofructokinase n=1 Tax=Desulfuromonas versatilis TaxID=2802975 RepID=A0ABN6E017_9BACT|nr:6-phosphofructokinase [Desulfuromonas versatilis]BCR04804.1 ATP-dependent 6-phosphofructokinase [Desulfuromonas versatilis]